MTKKIIALHEQGFVFDFHFPDTKKILRNQYNNEFSIETIYITLVDKVFDQFSHTFKYIHAIETCCGAKGLLLADTNDLVRDFHYNEQRKY